MDPTPTPQIERLAYFDSEDVDPQMPLELRECTSPFRSANFGSDDVNAGEDEEGLADVVDVSIPGFSSLKYIYGTSEERVYTLVGTDSSGTEKRLRFAPGKHGRARLRLRHELDVLNVLAEYNVPQIPEIEKFEQFPDRGICAIYPHSPVRTFHEFLDEALKKSHDERIGEILQFAQSLTRTLSAAHIAGVFRKTPFC